jgi:spore germination protein GerM
MLAGCGLSAEKRPHEISDRAIINLVSPSSVTTAPTSANAERQAQLYFVRGDELKAVAVPAGQGPLPPARVLSLLLNGRPRFAPKDLTTSIPPSTTLRGTSLSGSTLRIDLSGEIKSLGGTAAKTAYAQLVYTALRLPRVRSVRFAIEGNNIDAITDDGSRTVIQAKNYKRPLNPT